MLMFPLKNNMEVVSDFLSILETTLLHRFSDRRFLEEALQHPSMGSHKDGVLNYERLEFLGDAVLGLVVTEMLMHGFTAEPEGDLAKRRAALVCREALTGIASQLKLGNYLKMTDGEAAAGGRENPANLEDSLEAVIGALYLDGGLPAAQAFILQYWGPLSQSMSTPPKDPKTALQEWAQARGRSIPSYQTVIAEGPAHAPTFTIEVQVQGLPSYRASATSKRIAEREAAKLLLEHISKHADIPL